MRSSQGQETVPVVLHVHTKQNENQPEQLPLIECYDAAGFRQVQQDEGWAAPLRGRDQEKRVECLNTRFCFTVCAYMCPNHLLVCVCTQVPIKVN